MITIKFMKEMGLVVKHNEEEIFGVKNVKINIDSNPFGPLPQIILTIEPTELKIITETNDCLATQPNQQPLE